MTVQGYKIPDGFDLDFDLDDILGEGGSTPSYLPTEVAQKSMPAVTPTTPELKPILGYIEREEFRNTVAFRFDGFNPKERGNTIFGHEIHKKIRAIFDRYLSYPHHEPLNNQVCSELLSLVPASRKKAIESALKGHIESRKKKVKPIAADPSSISAPTGFKHVGGISQPPSVAVPEIQFPTRFEIS